MKRSVQYIADIVKAARLQKGLSQRDLSTKTGISQGHISKIENGAIDVQVSTLLELSRVLDMEVMLIPRTLVPTVSALQRGLNKKKQEPMYLPDEADDEEMF